MKITADTNVLIRALTGDDPLQSRAAQQMLDDAELVAIPTAALCELAWVLRTGYKVDKLRIAGIIKRLVDSARVAVDRPAAEAGLELLQLGGDFADGVIAFEGRRLGAETFVSFDRDAAKLIGQQGGSARLLA